MAGPRRLLPPAVVAVGFALAAAAGLAAVETDVVSRQIELAAALPAKPVGIGAPATDRATWARLARELPNAGIIEAARIAAETSPPDLPDELYLEYKRTGNRTRYQKPNKERIDRLALFAWAEALEHQGRWVPALTRELDAMLAEKTWVLPAHDPELLNFTGRKTQVDLMVAMRGWVVATVLFWHADQLPPPLVARARTELRRRVVDPYLAQLRGTAPPGEMWWRRAENNWNAVCHAGVVGTALVVVESPRERAEIIAATERDLEAYLAGFSPDGYCSEGVGYWNYGFGHFVMLAETLAEATGGRVQLLHGSHAERIAAYPRHLEILPGVYPAFADMDVKERPSPWFQALASHLLGRKPGGLLRPQLGVPELRDQLLYETALKAFVRPADGEGPAEPESKPVGGFWFEDAQVYVGRASPRFGVAIKGGHNAENHNHNDVGSFVVAAGATAVLVDPGLEVYTARTFGPDRYVSQVLNSYGHAVPVVADQLQHEGRQYAARVLATRFAPEGDTIVLDLAGAYAVPGLKSLVRTLTVRRGTSPAITVVDDVEYAEPASFSTALITFGAWREVSPGAYAVESGTDGVLATVAVDGADWALRPETLREELPGGRLPTRLGIVLQSPVRRASIRVTITPR